MLAVLRNRSTPPLKASDTTKLTNDDIDNFAQLFFEKQKKSLTVSDENQPTKNDGSWSDFLLRLFIERDQARKSLYKDLTKSFSMSTVSSIENTNQILNSYSDYLINNSIHPYYPTHHIHKTKPPKNEGHPSIDALLSPHFDSIKNELKNIYKATVDGLKNVHDSNVNMAVDQVQSSKINSWLTILVIIISLAGSVATVYFSWSGNRAAIREEALFREISKSLKVISTQNGDSNAQAKSRDELLRGLLTEIQKLHKANETSASDKAPSSTP